MFQNPQLQNMVAIGAVTPSTARIWARAGAPGHHHLRWRSADDVEAGRTDIDLSQAQRDHTGSVQIGGDLAPDTAYAVSLHDHSGTELASGRFRTAPNPEGDEPDRYAFALMSCHEPFAPDGSINPAAEDMLEAAHEAFREHDVRHIVMGGDQLYSDMPGSLSLFEATHFAKVAPPGRSSILDCDAQEVRSLFHARYRHFWNVPGWRRLMSEFPCYPILDDHEIVDNWGSAEEHAEPRWRAFRTGAFQAYQDYQHSLVREPSDTLPAYLDYTVEFADTGIYVMDLRSERRVGEDPRVVSDEQLYDLARFMQRHEDKRALFVVLSVPIIHLSRRLSNLLANVTPDGEDFSDRWSSRGHEYGRDDLLRLLRRQQDAAPDQRVVLLSGDIHIGCLHQVRWLDRTPNLYQFVSSGITHDAGTVTQVLSSLIIRANREVVLEDGSSAEFRLVRGEQRRHQNPCGRLNFGIIEVERGVRGGIPSLRMLLYSHRGNQPSLSYRSPPIPLPR